MISAASTGLVILGIEILEVFSGQFDKNLIVADPGRVVQAIIVGVSFVGAGSILKEKETNMIRNLNTATTILAVTTVGVAVALSRYYFAISMTLITLFINWVLMYPEQWLRDKAGKVKKRLFPANYNRH